MSKNLVALLCLGLSYNVCISQTLPIIAYSDPHEANKSTDFISSGNFTLGITSRAGGAINSVKIPTTVNATNKVDIMGTSAETYGRLSQANIRDSSHNYVYNPTQAGFGESLGTPCIITNTSNKLTIVRHRMALWNGDNRYDFIKGEELGSDRYNPRNNDVDNIDEAALGLSQSEEISSEFSFGGYYENFKPKLVGLASPVGVILYHHNFDFNYLPGACLSQFTATGGGLVKEQKTDDFMPVFDTQKSNTDISVSKPDGKFKATDTDLSNLFARITFTWDYQESGFDPTYRYFRNGNIGWTAAENRNTVNGNIYNTSGAFQSALIISESGTDNAPGRSLGFYKPRSYDNLHSITGRKVNANNDTLYTDNREYYRDVFDGHDRLINGNMSILGFSTRLRGMINRTRLLSIGSNGKVNQPVVADGYESLGQDYFFIYGNSPKEVKDAIDIIESYIAANGTQVAAVTPSLLSNQANNEAITGPSITIFPNPATNLVNIKLSNNKATNISIFNEAGKLVFTKASVIGNVAIPSAQIGAAGIYFIKTDTKSKQFVIAK